VYYLWYYDELNQKQKVSTKCTNKADALKFLQHFKSNELEKKVRLKKLLMSKFIPDFLQYSKSVHTVKTQKVFQDAFKEFIRVIGDHPLHRIGIREIESFLAIKKEEASDWTARKYFAALASAFETAKRWNCISINPFRNVKKPQIREIQPVYFTQEDIQLLLVTIKDKNFKELCLCALLTGMRLGELLSLEWSQIDFVKKVIFIKNTESFTTKSRKNRIVPMTDDLWKMLALRKERADTALVFHSKGKKLKDGSISQKFKKIVRKAKLDDRLHFHSLRHTFTSWMVQKGVSLYAVKEILGHSDFKTTQIYSHLQPGKLHSEMNKISISMN
jgi:integrase